MIRSDRWLGFQWRAGARVSVALDAFRPRRWRLIIFMAGGVPAARQMGTNASRKLAAAKRAFDGWVQSVLQHMSDLAFLHPQELV